MFHELILAFVFGVVLGVFIAGPMFVAYILKPFTEWFDELAKQLQQKEADKDD